MLKGLSWLYGKVIDARNSLYTKNLIRVETLPAPTISVGNISVGGTGKTPLVEFIAHYLASKGENVCIISRGYKRRDESKRVLVSDKESILAQTAEAGDEPYELALKLLGKSYVIADSNRVSAANWAFEEFGVTVFVLDDAFQHRSAGRDLDIAVVDATNPFGNFQTLPAGNLREPAQNLVRADAIVLSRSNLSKEPDKIVKQIREFAPEARIIVSRNETGGFRRLDDFRVADSVELVEIEQKAFVFCGLGNPANFVDQLVASGIDVAGKKIFPDHHSYSEKDIEQINIESVAAGAKVLITTGKDAVKLDDPAFSLPCVVCESKLLFDDEKSLTDLIDKALIR